jgi:hypothetical protein
MRNQSIKRFWVLLIGLVMISSVSFSQFNNVDFLRSAPADGVKYLQAYLSPWANAFGSGLSGGWYNTAKPHKFGGFDITMGVSVGFVPSSANTFDVTKIGLSSSLSGTGTASTVSGPQTEGPLMTYRVNGQALASFNTPKGTDWHYIPVPTAQVGIGLPLGTEVKIRFIPKIKIQDGDVSLWGVGLVHSIMQYLPGYKLSPFDVSLFGGYTKLQGNVPLGLEPDPAFGNTAYVNYNAATSFKNQILKISVQALNISAIGSVNLKVITFYGGLGYCKTQTLMTLSGNYPMPTPIVTAPYVQYNDSGVKKGTDFPKLDIKNFSGLRANVGLRLKLAVVTIHVDYTRAQYNVVTAGLGFSLR